MASGLSPSGKRHGTGLRNTRERLAHLYGDAGHLEIMSRPTGGTIVRVTLPFRREPDPLAHGDADIRALAPRLEVARGAGGRA